MAPFDHNYHYPSLFSVFPSVFHANESYQPVLTPHWDYKIGISCENEVNSVSNSQMTPSFFYQEPQSGMETESLD